MKVHDSLFQYRGRQGVESHCRIRIYRHEEQPVVFVATELKNNPGSSITNTATQIATALWQQEGRPDRFVWIEHSESYGTFTIVEFDRSANALLNPYWTQADRPTIVTLTGEDI
jgi:hypothetical protein